MKEDMGSRRKRGFKPKGKENSPAHEASEKAGGYGEMDMPMPMMAAKKGSRRKKGKSARGC